MRGDDILAYNKELNNDTIVWHPGDNTKNMGASAFGKAKNDCSWGLGEAVSSQGVHDDAPLKAWVGSPPTISLFK